MKSHRSFFKGAAAASLSLVIMAAAAAFCYARGSSGPSAGSGGEDLTEISGGEGLAEASGGEDLTETAFRPEERETGTLTLENVRTGELIAAYPLQTGDTFSIGFIHSVNRSPVTDYYELREDGIYVVKTVYYGFGAGVQTELEEGQTLTYGDDGSMIITGFDRRMDDLIYFVGTVSDHTMVINEEKDGGETISLRDLCGRNAMVRFTWTVSP